jgi:hypothetical protein
VLTHGWRFFVIISVIILYTHLHFFLREHYRNLQCASGHSIGRRIRMKHNNTASASSRSNCSGHHYDELALQENPSTANCEPHLPKFPCAIHVETAVTISRAENHNSDLQQSFSTNNPSFDSTSHPTVTAITATNSLQNYNDDIPTPHQTNLNSEYRKVRKILRMRSYPTLCVILWIPGIANRLVEASGGSSKVLQLMQASTQFVGLANAVTYGWNEKIYMQLREKFQKRSDRRADNV